MRYIGLLDCNNFFVSCERLFRPDLIGKPVVVLSSNDGCVVARSQEVKDNGVLMGVPYFQIKDKLQELGTTVFSSHFALYRDISRRVFSVMKEELAVVEQYSIDEAFFLCNSEPEAVAWRVKRAVEQRVGIPVSIGLANTKTLAKYANRIAKKTSGVFVLTPDDWRDKQKDTPLVDIWGVGGRMELRYKHHGLVTVADLLAVDRDRIARLFGVGGVRLYDELSGQAVFPLTTTQAPQKSLMHSRSFRSASTEYSVVADAVAYHIRHAMAELRAMGLCTTSVRVLIRPSRHGDFLLRGGTKEAVLPVPTDDTFTVMKVAEDLTRTLFEVGVPYQKAGVILSQLSPKQAHTTPLFFDTTHGPERTDALLSILDSLNNRKNQELVVLGSRLKTTQWQAKADVRSPAYTTRWSDIATVRAR